MKVLLDIELTLRQNVVFDYLHVNDLVEVVRRLVVEDRPPGDLNVTPTESISLLRIVEIIASASGRDVRPRVVTEGFNFAYTGDNGRLLAALPDLKFTPYEDGIRGLYAWYEMQRNVLNRSAVMRDEFLGKTRSRAPFSAAEG